MLYARAAQFGQFLGDPAAALVLGRHDEEGRAGGQRPQGKGERGAALDGAGRREQDEIGQRAGRDQRKAVGPRYKGRELARAGRNLGEVRRRRAKNIVVDHALPGRSG